MPEITSLRMSISEVASSPPTVEFYIVAQVDLTNEDIARGVGYHIYFCVYDTMQESREVILAANGIGIPVTQSIPPVSNETILLTSTQPFPPPLASQTYVFQDTLGAIKPAHFGSMKFRAVAFVQADNGPAAFFTYSMSPPQP